MQRRLSYAEKGKGPAEPPPPPPRTARIRVPAFDSSELIKKHALTLVGRMTNPKFQRVWSLIPFLSEHWKCETRPIGADLGNGCFQFQFESERDLVKVLENQPYHFAHWMVVIQRWEPTISSTFPNQIPFWIEVKGIPLHLWSADLLSQIAADIGTFDYSVITSTAAKMRVFIDALQPLIKKTTLDFGNGQELELSLVYEKLHNHCTTCFSLCHIVDDCPEKPLELPAASRSPLRRNHQSVAPRSSKGVYSKDSYSSREPQVRRGDSSGRNPRRNHREYPEHQRDSKDMRVYSNTSRQRDPPSTERTITARNIPDREFRRESRERDNSLYSYHSREYRRHHPYQSRPPMHSWRAKQLSSGDRDHQTNDFSDSSRPHLPPAQLALIPPADLPVEALEVAREEVRDFMAQYSSCADPIESAARRERLRVAEEQGEIEEAATNMVRSAMASQSLEEAPAREMEITPPRIPVAERLGPRSEPRSALQRLGGPDIQPDNAIPQSVDANKKRKPGRPPRRTPAIPLSRQTGGARKRRVTKAAPSPRAPARRTVNPIPRNEENNHRNNTSRGEPSTVPQADKAQRVRAQTSGRPLKKKGTDFQIPPYPLP